MRHRLTVPFAAAGIVLLALVAIGPDFAFWRAIDRGAAPAIRALTLGDQDYYLLRVQRVLTEGGPIGSTFFWEHRSASPRFFIFETLLGWSGKLFGTFVGHGIVTWANLLRAVSVSGLYLLLAWTFRRWARLPAPAAFSLALAACLWQEPFAMQVQFALGSWFMPLVLSGLILAVEGFAASAPRRRLLLLLAASLCFSVHPIAFASGAVALGLVWLARLYANRDSATLAESAAWGLPTLALGFALFGRFLATTAAAAETLARNAAIATYLPVMPLSLVRAAAVLILILLCRRRARTIPPPPSLNKEGVVWDTLAGWSLATFALMNVNLLTGRYFLGDHFLFFERILSTVAGASALALPVFAPSRKERFLSAAASLGLAAYALGWLVGHPPRSWLLFGFALPYFAGNAAMLWVALGKPKLPLPKPSFALAAAAVAVSTAYAGVFLWRLNRGFAPRHAAAQTARPLLEAIRLMPPGVLLASPELSDLASMYTPHRPYWTPRAFLDEAPNAELERRWRDALAFFPADAAMTSPGARAGLYGAENQFCDGLAERRLYAPLARKGLMETSLCRETKSAEAWATFAAVAAREEAPGAAWRPTYRLDYLALDLEKGERLPPALQGRFKRLMEAGVFAIYRYRP